MNIKKLFIFVLLILSFYSTIYSEQLPVEDETKNSFYKIAISTADIVYNTYKFSFNLFTNFNDTVTKLFYEGSKNDVLSCSIFTTISGLLFYKYRYQSSFMLFVYLIYKNKNQIYKLFENNNGNQNNISNILMPNPLI